MDCRFNPAVIQFTLLFIINPPVVYSPFFRNFTAVLCDPLHREGHQRHDFPIYFTGAGQV
jgi:hypothetical protein